MTKDGFYTSGEFAKMANISLRTVRYYDKQGVLKPSKVADNGYRLYSKADFAKLQKILSLKFLGFSLEEIMGLTINDGDRDFMKESIDMQLDLVQQKIDHLQSVKKSLCETKIKMNRKEEVDWAQVLPLLHTDQMDRALVEQYKNASNLEIRINLHKKYSQNPEEWFQWIFRQLHLKDGQSVLEIGCGNGELWKKNEKDIPSNVSVIVSDKSSGMVKDAKKKIGEKTGFQYGVFDCREIPYKDSCFDLIIANHVMFYLHDREHVLHEINRVLKPGGTFICSTYGKQHMKEITQLIQEFDQRITLSEETLYEVFGLENGKTELKNVFDSVKEVKYEDALIVDQAEPLISYIVSCHGNQQEYLSQRYLEFKEFVQGKIEKNGAFHITKEAGVFVSKKKNEA
ncbi:MAG: methyltransferase domain-containing protein [Anaerostipes sp.]|nr:methyltransferase domain-containing protein [Anaerostipes sp.]